MITEKDKEAIKILQRLDKDTWGMLKVLPYYLECLPPDKKYDLMVDLEQVQEQLKAEGELL